MTSKGTTRIQRGQAITFRLPSDTPDHLLLQLQKLKETERRNFSSTIAQFALEGISFSLKKERETLTIPLPKQLSKAQRSWLKHSHSEALLGSIVYQLLADPVRATSILASLNSNALDIDQALYLQDHDFVEESYVTNDEVDIEEEWTIAPEEAAQEDVEDDLNHFDWSKARQEQASTKVEELDVEEEDLEDLLGSFLANMNK
jgi:hypothetical protein